MTTSRILRLLILTALPAFALHPTASKSASELKVHSGRPVVSGVYVNGHGPYRFLLDTGAESNQLDRRISARLGLVATYQIEILTSNGGKFAPATNTVEIRVGGVAAKNQELLFTETSHLKELSPQIDGVLGQAFLSRFDYLLDLRHRALVLNPELPNIKSRIVAEIEPVHGRLCLFTSLGRLVLDSGTDHVILFDKELPNAALARILTASGITMSLQHSIDRPLQIEGVRIPYEGGIAIPKREGISEEGLLPVNLFRRIYVSNSTRRIYLD